MFETGSSHDFPTIIKGLTNDENTAGGDEN